MSLLTGCRCISRGNFPCNGLSLRVNGTSLPSAAFSKACLHRSFVSNIAIGRAKTSCDFTSAADCRCLGSGVGVSRSCLPASCVDVLRRRLRGSLARRFALGDGHTINNF